MLPNKSLQGKRLCTYKDTACSAYGGTTAHCLRVISPLQGRTTFNESLVRYTSLRGIALLIIVSQLFVPCPAFPDTSLILGRVVAERGDFFRNLVDLASHILGHLCRVGQGGGA